MYSVKLKIPIALRDSQDVAAAMMNRQPKHTVIKKAEMELRQQEIDLSAKQLHIKFEQLAIEKKQLSGLEEIQHLLQGISGQLDHISNSRAIFYDEFNTRAATMAYAIASKVINGLVDVDDNFILNIVNNAIRESGTDDELVIKINPDDKKVLDSYMPKLKKEYYDKEMVIAADPDINRGSCIIETESGDIDARIEKQMAVIEKTLLEYFGSHHDGKEL